MDIFPTCAVSVTVNHLGEPYSRALVTARRHKNAAEEFPFYPGYRPPEVTSVETDINGTAVLNLWPNALGVYDSIYEVTFHPRSVLGKRLWIYVPNLEAANMDDLIQPGPKFKILPPPDFSY